MPKRKTPPTPKKTPAKRQRKGSNSRKPSGLRANFVLGQHDARVDYVAKKPKYNRALKKFQDKVMKVLYQRDPKFLKVKTLTQTATAVTATTEQAWQIFHMRPYNGTAATPGAGSLYNEQAQDDILDIQAEMIGQPDRIKILRSEMEVSLVCSGAGVVEIYELVYLKKTPASIIDQVSFNAVLTDAIANLGVMGTALSLNRRGITPFDITSLVKDYGVKVIKKSVFLVQSNQGMNYRMTDYSHDVFDNTQATDAGSGFCLPGTTRSALVIYKPVATEATGSIQTVCNKRYQLQLVRNTSTSDQAGRD